MSATREDALPAVQGRPLHYAEPMPEVSDPTSDIADEVTSELGGVAAARPAPAQAEGAAAAVGPAAAGNVLRDRYVLESRLGAGGTAVVHRAVDLRRDASALDGRHVAIKLLRPELRDRPHAIARLQREFRQSLAAAHAGVVRVFDLDCDRGAWFIVMEMLSGEPLGALLRRPPQPGLPAAEALRFACLAGDALAHAHAVGIVHGDVKPDNLFLTDAGELRVLDFGSVPDAGSAAGFASAAAATRNYASPERLGGAAPAPADDVFSLACVTYEMLAGAPPFGGAGADRAAKARRSPRQIASLDEDRWAILAKALSFERDARPSMAEFLRALRREPRGGAPAAVGEPAPLLPPDARLTAPAAAVVAPREATEHVLPRIRRPWVAATLAAAVLGLVLLAGILIGRQREPERILSPPVSEAAAALGPAATVSEPLVPQAAPAEVGSPPEAAGPEEPLPAPAEIAGPPGLVFFDSPRMTVSRNAVVAAIPMRNLSKVRRSVTVTWRIAEGTAQADRDFAGPVSGSETFIEGNSFRILYVPILESPAARRDRRFVVEMTEVSPGASLGPIPRVEVTILGDA